MKTKIRKKRSGISNVISAVILIAAVSVLGSVMLIWANSTLGAQRQQIGDYYEENSNLLKETFIVEDIWLSQNPANYVTVTLRNVGGIAVDIKEVQVIALNSTGGTVDSEAVIPPFLPASSEGLISSKDTLRIDVGDIDWDHVDSKSLDISVTTERGSIQRVIWKVE